MEKLFPLISINYLDKYHYMMKVQYRPKEPNSNTLQAIFTRLTKYSTSDVPTREFLGVVPRGRCLSLWRWIESTYSSSDKCKMYSILYSYSNRHSKIYSKTFNPLATNIIELRRANRAARPDEIIQTRNNLHSSNPSNHPQEEKIS